jgi:hypothetical protein
MNLVSIRINFYGTQNVSLVSINDSDTLASVITGGGDYKYMINCTYRGHGIRVRIFYDVLIGDDGAVRVWKIDLAAGDEWKVCIYSYSFGLYFVYFHLL